MKAGPRDDKIKRLKISKEWEFFVNDTDQDLEFLKTLGQVITDIADLDFISLYALRRNDGRLELLMQRGEGINFIDSFHFPTGRGLAGWVAQKGKEVHLPDIHRGARHSYHPIRCFLSLPLKLDKEVIGVLNFGHRVPNIFEGGKYEQVQTLATHIAVMLSRWQQMGPRPAVIDISFWNTRSKTMRQTDEQKT